MIQIQEWDKEIYALKEATEELPLELEGVRKEVDVQKNGLLRAEENLKKLQLKQKEKEVELQSKEDSVRKYEGQLTQVKTNKEYSSLQLEIKSLKADVSLIEESTIGLMDQAELEKKKVGEERSTLKAKEELWQSENAKVQEKIKIAKEKIDELSKLRDEKIKLVHPEAASLYERIVRNKKGLALVKFQSENCPACQIQLRPQVINEIKLKASIVICENCSRILYE